MSVDQHRRRPWSSSRSRRCGACPAAPRTPTPDSPVTPAPRRRHSWRFSGLQHPGSDGIAGEPGSRHALTPSYPAPAGHRRSTGDSTTEPRPTRTMSSSRARRAAGTAPIRAVRRTSHASSTIAVCTTAPDADDDVVEDHAVGDAGALLDHDTGAEHATRTPRRPRRTRATAGCRSAGRSGLTRAAGRSGQWEMTGPAGVVEDVELAGQQVAVALQVGVRLAEVAPVARRSARRARSRSRSGAGGGARRSRRARCRRRPRRRRARRAQLVERLEERLDAVDEDLGGDRAGARAVTP